MQRQIAKATQTFIGIEDHGILTATIKFDYGGAGQGIPMRFFGSDRVDPSPAFGRFIWGALRAFGVDAWEKIPGRTVYALIQDGIIVGIEPLETERGKQVIFDDVCKDGYMVRVQESFEDTVRKED